MSPRQLAHGLLASGATLALALSTVGCGAADEGDALGTARQNIQGGYADENDSAVVGIFDNQIGGMCSGSLIAPNVVLTARHCVSNTLNETPEGGVWCPQTTAGSLHDPSQFFVTTKSAFSYNNDDYHMVREVIGLPIDTKLFCGNDQAILILSDNVSPDQAVPYVPRVDEPLVVGEEYSAVGYGQTSDSAQSSAGERRRRDKLFISCVADGCPDQAVKPTEWVGDTGICSGDSGGPGIDLANRVIGVTSRGASGCDSPVYGYVLGWSQWIKDVTNYAAGLGQYPPPPWANGWPTDPQYSQPIGDACTQPSDCASNRCLDDGQGSYCTRACNAASPCPDGWACDEANLGVCVQQHVAEEAPKNKKGSAASDDGGCSMGDDPTKPIPWKSGALLVGLAALASRRRRAARPTSR